MSRAASARLLALGALLALAGSAPPARAGGGWVPARGASYLELSAGYLATAARYDADARRAPFTRLYGVDRPLTYRDVGLTLYGELGLGGGFALEGDLPLRRVQALEPATAFRTAGAGDLRVAVKRGFRAGPLAWAASLETRLPLGYAAAEYPSLGSGHADFAAGLAAGYGTATGYAQAEIGVRRRGGPPADEWPYAAQLGRRVAPALELLLDARGNGLFGTGGVPAAAAGGTFDPGTASSRIALLGPGVAWRPSPGVRLSLQSWRTLAGRNAPLGWRWKLGVARVR